MAASGHQSEWGVTQDAHLPPLTEYIILEPKILGYFDSISVLSTLPVRGYPHTQQSGTQGRMHLTSQPGIQGSVCDKSSKGACTVFSIKHASKSFSEKKGESCSEEGDGQGAGPPLGNVVTHARASTSGTPVMARGQPAREQHTIHALHRVM